MEKSRKIDSMETTFDDFGIEKITSICIYSKDGELLAELKGNPSLSIMKEEDNTHLEAYDDKVKITCEVKN